MIQRVIHISANNKFFLADAVFIIPTIYNGIKNTLILIYQDDVELPTFNDEILEYTRIVTFRKGKIYSMIINKDINIYNWFYNTVIIHDTINIAPRIFSALKPILYNEDKLVDTLQLNSNTEDLEINFYGLSSWKEFIKFVVLSMFSFLNNMSDSYHIVVSWDGTQRYNTSYVGTISILPTYNNNGSLESKIQEYLYLNFTEFQLTKVEFKKRNKFFSFSKFSEQINNITIRMLAEISNNQLTEILSNNWSTEYAVSIFIEDYLYLGKILYSDIISFIKINNSIFNEMLEYSISEYTARFITVDQLGSVYNKILLEYDEIIQTNIYRIFKNYLKRLSSWQLDSDDTVDSHVIMQDNLRNILTIFNEANFRPKNNYIDKNQYFVELYRALLMIYKIPRYYYAYIPYCIKYLYNHAF